MRFNKHQSLTLTVIFILCMSFIGVILGSVVITAMAHSESVPWYISLSGMERTATPFQPNSFANILEDGSIELIPQPMFTPTPVPVIPEGELPENQVNILMLGVDDFGENNFRTDVIMLLSVNPKHQTASLISFHATCTSPFRDTGPTVSILSGNWVVFPCYKRLFRSISAFVLNIT